MCGCTTVCVCGSSGRKQEAEEKSCGGEILATAISVAILGAFIGPGAALVGGLLGAGLGASACATENENRKRIGR